MESMVACIMTSYHRGFGRFLNDVLLSRPRGAHFVK